MALIEKLKAIGDGFRSSRGIEQEFTLDEMAEMASEPVNVQPKLQSKSVNPTTEKQTITPDADYNGLSQVEVEAVKQARPADIAIHLNSQQGIIVTTATQEEGYVAADVWNERFTLPSIAKKTITPGTTDQTIAAGNFLTGVQTIKGDSNLVPDNIKKGVSIFGVEGNMESGSESAGVCEVTINNNWGVSDCIAVGYITPAMESVLFLLDASGASFSALAGTAVFLVSGEVAASFEYLPSGTKYIETKGNEYLRAIPLVGSECTINIESIW